MLRKAALITTLAVLPWLVAAQEPPELTFPARAIGASSATMRQLFNDYWEWRLADSPELATQVGRAEYNDRWRDWSKAARDRARAARAEFLLQVLYVATGNLTRAERLSAHLLEHELRTELDAEPYLRLVERVSQMRGAHNQVFTVIDQMPARTARDYENIVARLRAVPVYVDQTIALLREQLAAGLAQPAVVVDLMLAQMAAQRRPAAADSPLLAALRTLPDAMPEADRERLRAQATAAYEQAFLPGWTRLESFLRETYRPRARPAVGLTSIPDGDTAYGLLVRTYTSTRMTPEEIHDLGLREVARIEQEMQAIARELGFDGPAAELAQQIESRPDMRFSSQAEMLAYARGVLERVEPLLPRLFTRLPRIEVGIRPIPPDREAASASSYTPGTADGSRPAWFNLNTYRPEAQVTYPIDAVVLHETLPGHHLQTALALEIEGLPEFRRVFSAPAFSEGWALYAESLGTELGVYREPETRVGQLSTELFRAVRLVVDTGIHARGWSRDRAREYFSLHAPGQSMAEVDRYIAWPGQALAYKVGELKIRELRRRAEQELGARFDIRAFHDVVLRNGRIPLDILEEQVDAYIAAAKIE